MRAGPLSNDKIISLLNRYFVPFYLSIQDYINGTGGVSKEESTEFQKVMGEFNKTNFSRGTVHVYVFTADLVPLGSLHVGDASNIDVLNSFLTNFVSKLGVSGADPSFAPRPQSVPPIAGSGSLILHVFVRGFTILPEFPHEDWVILTPEEARSLLPPSPPTAGTAWPLNVQTSTKFAERLHPTLEWFVDNPQGKYKTRIEKLEIKATALPANEGVFTAKLEGKLKMLRPTPGSDPDKSYVRANLIGYLKFKDNRILSLDLIAKDAFYGDDTLADKEFEGYVEAVSGSPRELSPRTVSLH